MIDKLTNQQVVERIEQEISGVIVEILKCGQIFRVKTASGVDVFRADASIESYRDSTALGTLTRMIKFLP